jgi:uncharacterized membrane protein
MIKGNSYRKFHGMLIFMIATGIGVSILWDTTGVLALVGLGVGIGFVIGITVKG